MAKDCCDSGCSSNTLITPRYRKILMVALAINAAMFIVEVVGGFNASSVSLMADAIDFFGDAMNYAISLLVLSMSLMWRARAALFKGLTMGLIGTLALAANVSVALLLYAYREGGANMRSVWLCSRNDAIGNLAVILAAVGVFGSGRAWPDLLVALIMASLSLTASFQISTQAFKELNTKSD